MGGIRPIRRREEGQADDLILAHFERAMIAAGYMAKIIAPAPQWLKAVGVTDVYSVSYCISNAFCDYIQYWKHNGYWFYDSPRVIEDVARLASVNLSGHKVLYYDVYEQQYDADHGVWMTFQSEDNLETNIKNPRQKQLIGWDVVSFSLQTVPECSPLSCNKLAESIAVNRYCLLDSFELAKSLLEEGAFSNSEPGPFRIFAVHA